MQLSDDALKSLGLEPGATDDEINAAIVAKTQAAVDTITGAGGEGEGDGGGGTTPPDQGGEQPGTTTPPETPPATPPGETKPEGVTIPDGMSLVDSATLEGMKKFMADGEAEKVAAKAKADKALLDNAIKDGKFAKARRAHYEAQLKVDRDGVYAAVAAMSPNMIPVEERGDVGGETTPEVAAAYPDNWQTNVKSARRGVTTSRVKVVGD